MAQPPIPARQPPIPRRGPSLASDGNASSFGGSTRGQSKEKMSRGMRSVSVDVDDGDRVFSAYRERSATIALIVPPKLPPRRRPSPKLSRRAEGNLCVLARHLIVITLGLGCADVSGGWIGVGKCIYMYVCTVLYVTWTYSCVSKCYL